MMRPLLGCCNVLVIAVQVLQFRLFRQVIYIHDKLAAIPCLKFKLRNPYFQAVCFFKVP